MSQPYDNPVDDGPADAPPVVDARDIRIWYGTPAGPVRAVDGVSFSIRSGEIFGLVGESGSGKSTIGRGLLGLLPPGSVMDGELEFKGLDLLSLGPKARFKTRGRDLAMIFQEPLTRLNPLMRVSEHFTETLRTHFPKITAAEIEERSLNVLKVIGIPPSRWKAYPHEFSGGMRQRIMIALALVLRPAFVVADEPTTALDVLVEAQIIKILHDLRENFDTSLLLITHNLGIIAEACDKVAVMYAGKIVEIGDAREVFAKPRHPYTQALLRSTITLTTDGLHSIPGAPPDLIDPPTGCHFHPRCPHAMVQCALAEPPMRNVHGQATAVGSTDV
ncbi:MAG: ABC transporter ATP-binding protein, partial [Propionibacteriaceae bacterium]|nr:ABC transporter ATP-binding protein [Propionibacteriaceae bacterium]